MIADDKLVPKEKHSTHFPSQYLLFRRLPAALKSLGPTPAARYAASTELDMTTACSLLLDIEVTREGRTDRLLHL